MEGRRERDGIVAKKELYNEEVLLKLSGFCSQLEEIFRQYATQTGNHTTK